MYRVSHVVTIFALCLLAGTCAAVIWANLAPQSYQDMVEWRLIDGFVIGYPNPDAPGVASRTLTLHYLVNNVGMALFFLLAGKEAWEAAVQPGGVLRGAQALVPLGATAGSMAVPALIYLVIAATTRGADWADLRGGWPVPMASDIVLAYLIGRTVFGRAHPALRLLLLVAVVSELATLLLTGLIAPPGPVRPLWLLVPLVIAPLAWLLFNRLPGQYPPESPQALHVLALQRRFGLLPWLMAGIACWYGVAQAGLHPALGLLPIVPAIPHARRPFGFFAEAEDYLTDPLNRIAHLLTVPAAIALLFYGLTNGGAAFADYDPATTVSFFALLIGKPCGLFAGAVLAVRLFGRSHGVSLPAGIGRADLALTGLVAACGFTVPLLAANATLPGGIVQQAAKLGLVLTVLIAPAAILIARSLHLGRWHRRPG